MDIKKRYQSIFSGWAKFQRQTFGDCISKTFYRLDVLPVKALKEHIIPKYMMTAYVTPAIMYDIPMQLMGNMSNVWWKVKCAILHWSTDSVLISISKAVSL